MAPAQAAKSPNALVTDARVKQVAFDPNQVYEIVGTYGYQTAIEFGDDEAVKVVTLGDSIAWQTVPYQNRLFIKPVEANASTNLTVITDKRTYYFKLTSAKGSVGQTFLVRFVYPSRTMQFAPNGGGAEGGGGSRGAEAPGTIRFGGGNTGRKNVNYSTSGDRAAIPLTRAFDDGQFTYFQFDPDGEIPAIYTVGPDGTESIVNTRREGAYLVAERIARQFTLRNGNWHLCVRNDGMRTSGGE
ncbi:TrbG/VirB9 family P-type conjugative transfer protein [Variovorax jilinensis]|uniref:TrbG/VirB9 family P-type conjugative transfer protein n=1 Tax=Variovorax jilinensis TaxID=3053513 RepID=UPI00257499B9|nr:TrbG/VirB9 family P-type conjugative transfer protein [Variovorax sp. J22P168]